MTSDLLTKISKQRSAGLWPPRDFRCSRLARQFAARTYACCVVKSLRFCVGGAGKVSDFTEAQVPGFVELGLLGVFPQLVDVATDQYFDVDARTLPHCKTVARAVCIKRRLAVTMSS
jgi:hypothetical protein